MTKLLGVISGQLLLSRFLNIRLHIRLTELRIKHILLKKVKLSPQRRNPPKEGYTFSGWSDIPSTMPDHDVTVTGSFTINKYKLTYMVDGEDYISSDVEYGATITPETAPTKEVLYLLRLE